MSRIINDLQSPYDAPATDAPDAAGDGVSQRGGRPMPSQGPAEAGIVNAPFADAVSPPGERETPNMSDLPARADGHTPGSGDPGMDAEIGVPDLDTLTSGRHFPTA